jgi:hypothetical protein
VRAAPARKEVEHVHHGILVGFPAILPQPVAHLLKLIDQRGLIASLSGETQGQGAERVYRFLSLEGLLEEIIHHRPVLPRDQDK